MLLSKYDPVHEKVEAYTINSCLTLLCSIHGCSVTTSEGIGNQKQGFHSIQQRLAGFHASQCGFCTPGMCMSLFSALINADNSNESQPPPPPGFSNLKLSEAEKAIAGNLCRCTGYRPIVDACKSFAADVDIEDLGYNAFWQKEESKDIKMLPVYDPSSQMSTFPDFLKDEIKRNMQLELGKCSWFTPFSIEELHNKLQWCDSNNVGSVKLVVSNTGTGYYKELEGSDTYIDLRYIPELSVVKRDSKCIHIGAAVSISKAIVALKEGSFTVFTKIAAHFEKIASGSIRNSASIGGNLVMVQRHGFPSDIATVLLAVDSSVEVVRSSKRETIKLEEFLVSPPLDSKSVMLSVQIPIWEPSSRSNCELMFETYRAAPRPLGNALPYLNAAFFAEVSPCKSADGSFMVNKIRLAFGAYGTKHAVRAKEVEGFLAGRYVNLEVLCKTLNLVQATVVPRDDIFSHVSYRKSLAEAFVFEFLYSLVDTDSKLSSLDVNGYNNSQSVTGRRVKEDTSQPMILPATQVILPSTEHHPVGKPISKTGAALQASGLFKTLHFNKLFLLSAD